VHVEFFERDTLKTWEHASHGSVPFVSECFNYRSLFESKIHANLIDSGKPQFFPNNFRSLGPSRPFNVYDQVEFFERDTLKKHGNMPVMAAFALCQNASTTDQFSNPKYTPI
jgi:hypothetical protein